MTALIPYFLKGFTLEPIAQTEEYAIEQYKEF